MTTYDEIKNLLKRLPHKYQVSFALYCAEDVFHIIRDEDKALCRKALDLTKAWLSGEEVSIEELRNAVNTIAYCPAPSAASYTANAAHTTYNAAYAAAYAASNSAAAYTASSAAYAAVDAANAASAASADAHKDKEAALKKYLSHLKTMIKAMSRIERLVYNLN